MIQDLSGRSFYAGLLEALVRVMGSAKAYLGDHAPRVGVLSTGLADAMGLGRRERSELFFAAVLSDLGMIGVAEDAWDGPVRPLNAAGWARVRRHPVRSEEHVASVPHLSDLGSLVRNHHEWWDGSGYPDGLAGEEIPLGARILRLADTVAALGRDRPHRPALAMDQIVEVVRRSSGIEFDPRVARVWLELHRGGDLPVFHVGAFPHAVARAAEHLLPAEVSPLSSDQLLAILSNLIDAKDPYTAGHSRRVAELAVAVAAEMGLDDHIRSTLWAGGYLHDVGKLRVPLQILAKRGSLTAREFGVVKQHPSHGAVLLEAVPSLRHLTTGARYHHERWDGMGYPEGLRGHHIPLVAQILAVCDAYDAMTSTRAYRSARTHAQALDEVAVGIGAHFSPRVASAFLALPRELFESVEAPAAERSPLLPASPGDGVVLPSAPGRRSASA